MNIENLGQEDHSKLDGGRKPTNLEARLEEARALRRKVLAQREQGNEGESENPDPANGSDASGIMAGAVPNDANTPASQTDFERKDAATTEGLASAIVARDQVAPPLEADRRRGRVAERLALGLGIGLGIGASLYLGASLSGARIGFVTADAPVLTEQPQQAVLDIISIKTSDVVSPTYISLVEPEAMSPNFPSETAQEAESSSVLSVQPEAVSSTYEMAPEDVSNDDVQLTQPSPDQALLAPILEASLGPNDPDLTPSLLPDAPATKLDIVPSDTSDPQSEPAPLPDQDIVIELIADPATADNAQADATEELGADPVTVLAKPDLRLPGAEAYTVVLNAPSTLSDEDVASVANDIAETGAVIGKVDRVNFRISATQVRFFHTDDAESAAAIAQRMGAEARDFTSYQPSPPAGTIEMFLAGSGGSGGSKKTQPALEEVESVTRAARSYSANDDR